MGNAIDNRAAELWNQLDILNSQIADLKLRREQLDEWIAEAVGERLEVKRELKNISDYEEDYG